ncbi:hypothetical protein niasHS_012878 [Heterodera schachtii]|uniref:Uncharacterized protein n=1 Tax=Heterodera schachtii TaxID=97005 RepID=A0ABD2IQC6_HETSC
MIAPLITTIFVIMSLVIGGQAFSTDMTEFVQNANEYVEKLDEEFITALDVGPFDEYTGPLGTRPDPITAVMVFEYACGSDTEPWSKVGSVFLGIACLLSMPAFHMCCENHDA